jgi:DNA-binding MarR family transcriptional regulator
LKLDCFIGLMLNRAMRKCKQVLMTYLNELNITPEQAAIIRHLGEIEGISQKDLATRVDKDQTNITRILDQLERKGMIRRELNSEDRRSYFTFLTDKGRLIDESLKPIEEEVMKLALRDFSDEEKKLFSELMNRVISNLGSGVYKDI